MTWPVNTARAGAARDDISLKESENAFGKNNYSLTSVQLLCPHTSALHLSPSQLVCGTVGTMCNSFHSASMLFLDYVRQTEFLMLCAYLFDPCRSGW